MAAHKTRCQRYFLLVPSRFARNWRGVAVRFSGGGVCSGTGTNIRLPEMRRRRGEYFTRLLASRLVEVMRVVERVCLTGGRI